MTEAEWLACDDPFTMLETLPAGTSERKLRLYLVACLRKVFDLLPNERCRQAVIVAERFADGMANAAERSQAEQELIPKSLPPFGPVFAASCLAGWAVCPRVTIADAMEAADVSTRCLTGIGFDENITPTFASTSFIFAAICYDMFGNPFRPVGIDPVWRTVTVTSLAEAIYEAGAFDRLPILADALEDAGCDNRDILDHCRQPGEHVRGCWVLDLVLGKS